MRRPAMIGFRFWAIHRLTWWGQKPAPCPRCRKVLAPGEECGLLKVDRHDFGAVEGSVEWRSWTPCSSTYPGGYRPVSAVKLDECGDLDDLSDAVSVSGAAIEVR